MNDNLKIDELMIRLLQLYKNKSCLLQQLDQDKITQDLLITINDEINAIKHQLDILELTNNK